MSSSSAAASQGGEFIPSIYQPPPIAVTVGSILRAPRTIKHHGNFSLVFSTDQSEQVDYVHGILVVEVVLLIIFIIWTFILLVLKFKGKEVGCASGMAFVMPDNDDDKDRNKDKDFDYDDDGDEYYDDDFNDRTRTTARDSSRAESLPSDEYVDTTSLSSGGDDRMFSHWDESSSVDYDDEELLDPDTPKSSTEDPGCREQDMDDRMSKSSRKKEKQQEQQQEQQQVNRTPTGNQLQPQPKVNKREFRTRVCFLFFATIALACIPLILVFSFGPMRDATQTSDEMIVIVQDITNQIESSLQSIELNSINAFDTVNSTPTDLSLICPDVDQEDLEAVLGIDLMDIINSISSEYDRLKAEVSSQLSTGSSIVEQVQGGLTTFETSIHETEEYLWVIPGLLFAVGILTAVSILGVILAWKDRSGSRFQCLMSWFVLPLLSMAMIACWGLVMAFSFSSIVGTDACTSSSSFGSPDQTIQEILSLHDFDQNSTAYQLANSYTNQCLGPDPTQPIQDVEADIQGHIDTIWRQMSKLDSLGRSDVMNLCGGETEEFGELVSGARNLARLLTGIRRSLDGMEKSLKCTMINPLYVQTAHEAACNDTLTSSVYGLIFFLVLSVCVMVMITLRSSWLRHIPEEKVYHDENDVAENMILDEHEEYLAYISRYKHEWQEYNGFDNEVTAMGSHEQYDDADDDFEDEGEFDSDYDGSDVDGEISVISDIDMNSPTTTGRHAVAYASAVPITDDGGAMEGNLPIASLAPDDISVPSLSKPSKFTFPEQSLTRPNNPVARRSMEPIMSAQHPVSQQRRTSSSSRVATATATTSIHMSGEVEVSTLSDLQFHEL